MFDERDDPVLNWLVEDAKKIEPEYYCTNLPVVLMNSPEGIGTGYSSFIPPYNPKDIKDNLKRLLNKEKLVKMTPWYKGFRGNVVRKNDKEDSHTWILSGILESNVVTELPPGRWIQDYKEFLDDLVENGKIKSYENHSTETTPRFVITWGSKPLTAE